MITEKKATNDVKNISQEISGLYCRLVIDEFEIITSNIRSIEFRNWCFELLPRCDITFRDDHLFYNASVLKPEKTEISIVIGSSEEDKNKKYYSFILNNFEFNRIGDVSTVTISAYQKTKNLFDIKVKAHQMKTSVDVLRSIASDIGLDFKSTPGLISNDLMTWLQRCSNKEFLDYVYKKSSIIGDISLLYTDLTGTLNFKSLNKEILLQQTPTKLEYKTDLFNAKTQELVDKYKEDHKISGNYGHFYSFQIKNYQQYFDYFISNGSTIVSYDQTTASKSEKKFDGKTYPMLTDDKDHKPYEGSIVNKEFAGIKSKTVHDSFYTTEYELEYNIGSFFSQALFTEVNYLCELNLLDKIELNMPDYIDGDSTTINVPYQGDYIIGGIYYNFEIKKDKILPKKTIIAFRPGANKPIVKVQK